MRHFMQNCFMCNWIDLYEQCMLLFFAMLYTCASMLYMLPMPFKQYVMTVVQEKL